MSSPAQGGYQGPSTHTEQSPGKQSKRPTALARHTSSWVNRLHRHHDRRHHQSDDDVERPLLANDHLDQDDEGAQSRPALPSPPPPKLHRFLSATNHHTRKAYDTSRKVLARNAKYILIACLLALLTLLASFLIGSFFHHKDDEKVSSCQSPECVHAASEILYNLDPNHAQLDACTQFDRMVCGGWEMRHDLRPDQGDMFTGTIMAERSKTILRHILEESSSESLSSPADQDNFRKLKDDYDSCMNEKELQDIGLKPLQEIINQIKIIFPATVSGDRHTASRVLETASRRKGGEDSTNQLTEALLYLIKLDIEALLAFDIQADDRDPDSQVLMVTPPRRIGLPSKEYYENEEVVREYRSMTATVLKQFVENPGNTTRSRYRRNSMSLNKSLYQTAPRLEIEDLGQAIADLEVELAAASPPTEDQEDVTKYYNPMTVAEIHSLLPQISIDYIIAQLAPKGYSPGKIIVGSPAYVATLAKLISSSTQETLQAFLVWKAIQRYEKKVEHPSLEPLRDFNNKLHGVDPSAKEERWRTCIDAVDQDLGWILSNFFIEAAFSEASKKFGDQIVTDIKDSFITTLDSTEWMAKDVRDRAIKKVHAIDQKIGYPTSNPDVLDHVALKEYYKGVVISDKTFFENKVQVAQFETRRAWNKLGKPTRHDEWGMTVPTVNAYYNPAGNEIVFPAGIMQAPVFYNPSVPQYLAYGAFGAVSGHELSHAFDSTGSHYDETGKYTDWFDESTKEAFENKTKCFEQQYSDFTITGPDGETHHVNGKLTLGENIADAGGLHAAFSAWKRREAEQPSEALPGLQQFSPEQLFFISYGNWWCGKSTQAKAVERIYTDPHAPKWARILGTMDNSAEFKKAFNCADVQPTCKLW